MTAPPTPKATRKAEALARAPPTMASQRKEDAALKKWPKPRLCCANGILLQQFNRRVFTVTVVNNGVAK
jgi:hypothetical protein